MTFTLLVVAGEREGETFRSPKTAPSPSAATPATTSGSTTASSRASTARSKSSAGSARSPISTAPTAPSSARRAIDAETDLDPGDEVVIGTNRLRLIELASEKPRSPEAETGETRRAGRGTPRRPRALRGMRQGHPAPGPRLRKRPNRRDAALLLETAPLRSTSRPSAQAPPSQPLPAAMLERFRPGQELAGVRVVSLLGEGRLGPLFKGEQVNIGRLVALKVLNVPDAHWTQRYLQAVYVSGQLVHSNIVLIFDIGQEENLSYVVREYVEGRSVQERLANREPVPLAEAHGIISQVVYALEHAAERHIFHGSLSPRKILLGPRDSVKVSGFGLPLTPPPRSSAASYNWHALPYTAPERVRGDEPPNFAGDVYSVVAVLYHLLSGHPPFGGSTRERIEQRILNAPPKPLNEFVPDIPAGAQKIIDRGLSKDPRARYQLPRELLFDLEENLKRKS